MKIRCTLKKVLTLNFILVAVLPMAFFGMLGVRIFSGTIEQEVATRNGQIARALAGEIDRFLAEPLRILEMVNDRNQLMRREGNIPLPDKFLRLLRGRYRVFEQIAIVDRQGRILHLSPSRPELIGTDLSGQPFFQEAVLLGHVVFSETFPSPTTGLPTIAVAFPEKEMVAVGYLSLDSLQEITDKIIVGRGSYAVVADRRGNIIAHPERHLVSERVNIGNLEPVRRALSGEVGTFPYEFRDIRKLGSTAIAGRTGWVVMLCQTEEEAFAPVVKIKMMLFAGLALTLLLALFLAAVVLKRPLRSISGLTDAARKISAGDYRLEEIPPGYPEIDILAGGFREMVREIANREDALLRSENKYRAFVEGSFDGIFLQKGGKIVFANRRLLEMVGYREEELLGRETWSIYAPEYQQLMKERALARLRGEVVPAQCEVQMLRRDGSLFPVEISARVVTVEGEPGIQVWVNDLSERRRIEEERKTSEQRFVELYDSVSDFIFTQDMEGRFLSCNRAMLEAFGYPREELIGRKASEFMKPELAPLFETEYMPKLKEQGRAQGVSAYYTCNRGRIYLEYRDDLIRPENGEPFVSGIARDVTGRILSERALKEREQSIFAVLQASPNPIVAYDTEGNVRFMNRAFTAVFGWTLEELSGRKVDFLPEEEKEKTIENIKELYRYEDNRPRTMETKRLTRDGRILDILTSAALIFDAKGKPAGMVVSSTDITQLKKLEAGLLQAQKMEAVGVLAGGIAHDFNNLLMGIQGNISLVLLREGLNGDIRRNIENVEALVSRGAGLTRQLLGFARGGKYEVKIHDMNEIIAAEAALFGETKKEIVVAATPAPDLWRVEADRTQMEQMLMNLFVNAGQAMPDGGHIDIVAENVVIDENFVKPYDVKPGRYVRVSVTDTGAGMDDATQKRIFEPFFTTKEAGAGTGLGLASTYGIIKNHGGFINVYSEKGKGSSFHIYLPASDARIGKDEGVAEKFGGVMRGEGTILLVDDEETIREVGREMLEVMGYTVITASGGAEAIEKFAAVKDGTGEFARIDIVIQDMIMPGMGGGEVFDRLKEIDPEVTVLLASGYSLNGQAKEILARGCRGFIQKPFTMGELSRKVREMMNGK